MNECKVDGCLRLQRKKSGYCSMHYSRKLRTGSLGPATPLRESWRGIECKVDGCSKAVKAKGYCIKHYDVTKYHKTDPAIIDKMKQSGCYVCGSFDRLVVDHNHACCPPNSSCQRCVRGILCHKCNTAAGLLSDDPEIMLALATYIMSTKDVLTNA